MSLILNANGGLLRDLWPGAMGRAVNDTTTIQELQPWQVMPATFEDLCDWGEVSVDHSAPRVATPGGPRTKYALLWSTSVHPDGQGERRHRVLLRLHGFLAAFSIQPLGNWKGKADDAKKAVQYVTLIGNGCNAAFEPQIETLRTIDNLVYRSLRVEGDLPQRSENALNLRRHVFSRINLAAPMPQQNVALPDSDRQAIRGIQQDWRVDHRLSLGMQKPNGDVRRASDFVFTKGDFVEVSVFVDILSFWDSKSKQRRVDIQYAPQEIIRLWSNREARAKLTENAQLAAAAIVVPAPPNNIVALNTAYNLVDDGNADHNMPDIDNLEM